jgi:hypothetical protein
MASIVYKKVFLDDSRSASMSNEDLETMKANVMNTIDFS